MHITNLGKQCMYMFIYSFPNDASYTRCCCSDKKSAIIIENLLKFYSPVLAYSPSPVLVLVTAADTLAMVKMTMLF